MNDEQDPSAGRDEIGDLARAAMQRHVEGVEADEDILARITGELEADPAIGSAPRESPSGFGRSRTRGPWPLVVAAAALAVVLGGLATWNRLTPDRLEVTVAPEVTGEPVNFLIVGTDAALEDRLEDRGDTVNADMMAVVRIDPGSGTVDILSLPRDLALSLADSPSKLGHVRAAEGTNALIEQIQSRFGIAVNHYVELDPQAFVELVDEAGGVEIDVLADSLHDKGTGLDLSGPGCRTLDGTAALQLARSRHLEVTNGGITTPESTGDIGRQQRQRVILEALLRGLATRFSDRGEVLDLFLSGALGKVKVDSELDVGGLLDLAEAMPTEPQVELHELPLQPFTDQGGVAGLQVSTSQRATDVLAQFGGHVPTPLVDQSSEPPEIVPAPQPVIAPCASPGALDAAHSDCSPRKVYVQLEPQTIAERTTDVDQALGSIPGIVSAEYWDPERSYAEFQELFANEPDVVHSVTPEDLPASFRVEMEEDHRREDWPNGSPAEGSPWQRIEELPGVLRVTAAGDYCRALNQASSTTAEPVIDEAPLPLASEAPSMPTTIVGVREDGWLLAVDLLTGEQTKVAFHGDPGAEVEYAAEVMYIDAVSVDQAGGWVYYSTCCEPAAGITYRVRLDGSSPEPEELGGGAYPSVSPDGRWVAVGEAQDIRIFDAADPSRDTRLELEGSVSQIAWSPSGDRLMVAFGEPQRSGAAQLVGFNGIEEPLEDLGQIDGADLIGFTPAGEPDPTTTGDGRQSMVTKTQDASGWWTLWVAEGGELYTGEVFDPEKRIGLESMPSFMTADW